MPKTADTGPRKATRSGSCKERDADKISVQIASSAAFWELTIILCHQAYDDFPLPVGHINLRNAPVSDFTAPTFLEISARFCSSSKIWSSISLIWSRYSVNSNFLDFPFTSFQFGTRWRSFQLPITRKETLEAIRNLLTGHWLPSYRLLIHWLLVTVNYSFNFFIAAIISSSEGLVFTISTNASAL